jgi:hypothetical protein
LGAFHQKITSLIVSAYTLTLNNVFKLAMARDINKILGCYLIDCMDDFDQYILLNQRIQCFIKQAVIIMKNHVYANSIWEKSVSFRLPI